MVTPCCCQANIYIFGAVILRSLKSPKEVKVSRSQKQFMVSPILPKKEKENKKNQPNSTMIPQVELFLVLF